MKRDIAFLVLGGTSPQHHDSLRDLLVVRTVPTSQTHLHQRGKSVVGAIAGMGADSDLHDQWRTESIPERTFRIRRSVVCELELQRELQEFR